jgi:hypothetical protein
MRLPSVLLPGDLPLAELCAARLDGELVAIDEGFLVADLPLGPPERAAALRSMLPPPAVADRLTAAWVHGALRDPPRLHSASIDRRRRIRPPSTPRLRCHEVLLGPEDAALLGGTAVTTPVRTLIDLARSDGGADVLRSLAAATGTALPEVLARLSAGPAVSGSRIVERRLRLALGGPGPPGAQPALTR